MEKKKSPKVQTDLRRGYVQVPKATRKASGIIINGKKFRSVIFTTDIAIIMNNDADAVIAVYPFTPHPAIIQAISNVSNIPVLAGVGGGMTHGPRSAQMALFAEAHGCLGVVVNSATPLDTVKQVDETVDIPVIQTVVTPYADIEQMLTSGVDIINVSGAGKTVEIVRDIHEKYPDLPIIATGGPTEESIIETIEAGANAITYTPPSNGEIFKEKMKKYRQDEIERYQ